VSVTTRKHTVSKVSRGRKKQVETEAAPPQPNPDFERQLQDHFAAQDRKKVEEETEHIFGSLLARHGWARNEHGQVEYVGGEGA
jgi:hypothetical protein